MKRLLWTVALLTAFVCTMNAQNNYSRLWSKVQKAEKEGKPQTAAGYLRELEEKTIKAGDELEQLVVSEALYEKLREYNWKEANAYYSTYSRLNRKVMTDSLETYLVKYKDHPRIVMLLYRQLRNHKESVDRKSSYARSGADYLKVREEAQALLKHKAVGTYRKSIQSLIDDMDGTSLSSGHHATLAPCDSVEYELSTRNIRAVEIKVYRLLDDRFFTEGFKDSNEETLRKNATLVSTQSFRDLTCDYNIRETHKVYVAFPQPGIYVVRFAATENRDGKAKLQDDVYYDQAFVSNVAGALRVRKGSAEVYAADWKTGRPYEQGKVSIYKNLYKNNGSAILPLKSWKTDRFRGEGFQRVETGKALTDRENDYLMRIEAEGDTYAPLIAGLYPRYYDKNGTEYQFEQAHLFTDRALYKPTDTIHFKLICYKAGQTSGHVLAGQEAVLTLRHSSSPDTVAQVKVLTNEMGSAAGVFTLPEGCKNGVYLIQEDYRTLQRVRVEEYKRPNFTVSLQPIGEPLCYGDVVKQGGQLRSYAGFSVAGGEIWYEIVRTSYTRPRGHYLGRETVMEGTVISDGDGHFEIAFPTERPVITDKDYENELIHSTYQISVRATDPQGETHETAISVPVADIPVELDLQLPDNEHFKERLIVDKDNVKAVTVNASTLNGTPYATEAAYTVTDAAGATLAQGTCKTNEPVAFDFGSLPSGDYTVKARTEFRGREITAERKVVVMSTDDRKLPFETTYFYYPVKTEGAIEFVLGTTEEDLWLELELFDDDNQLYREGVHLQNEMRKFVLPYKASYRSAVKMSVFGFRNGKGLDYTYQFTRPGDVRLDVAVETFRDKTTPGSEETMVVRAPAGSELMVSIYDVTTDRYRPNSFSFYPLQEYASVGRPEILTSLHERRIYNDRVMMRGYAAGAMVQEDALLASPMMVEKSVVNDEAADAVTQESSEAEEETPAFEGRSNFSELIAFYPQIPADKSGRTEIKYTAGDLLTTFKVLVLAHDKQVFAGDASAEFVVQKELMVLPNVPLFVTEGDRLVLKSKIVNLSNRELKGTAYIELLDENGKKLKLKGLDGQKRALLAGAQDEVSWTVEAPGGTEKLTARIWFATPTSSDGEQHEIKVVPATITLTEAASFILGGKHDHKYYEKQLRKQFGAADPKIEYAEYSTLDAVKESLPMAVKPESDNSIAWINQLYINQMRNLVLQDDPADYEAFRKQAFSKLKTFQSGDGGIQWFQGMKSNTLLTLYLLEKLGQLRNVNALTPEDDEMAFIRKALSYVDERIAVQGTYKDFHPFYLIRDFAVRSLWYDVPMSSAAKAVYDRFIDGTEDGWQKISILEKAQLANTLLRAAKTPYDDKRFEKRIKLLRESLKDYAVENPTVGCYFPNAVMPYRGLMNSEIYAHAQLIETFGKLGEKKVVDGIAQWLLLQKHNQAWENTVATTDAVHALVSSKAKDLKLGAVYYTYTTKLDRVKASANEITVTRSYTRAGGAPLRDGEQLHVGDEIVVTYSIYNTENRSFVQMRAMRPACFYPLDERSYFTWYGFYREVKPSETNYYWELLPEEHISVQESFYVQQEGTFNSGLVEIECLYAKEYRGHTDAVTLTSRK